MIDTENLRRLVEHYKFSTTPSNGDSSAPCSVGDIKKVITNTADLLNAFIAELEQSE